jgi:hypothetical protein
MKKYEACRIVVCDVLDDVRDKLIEVYITEPRLKEEIREKFNEMRRNYLKNQCGKAHSRFTLAGAIFYIITEEMKCAPYQQDLCARLSILAENFYKGKRKFNYSNTSLRVAVKKVAKTVKVWCPIGKMRVVSGIPTEYTFKIDGYNCRKCRCTHVINTKIYSKHREFAKPDWMGVVVHRVWRARKLALQFKYAMAMFHDPDSGRE